MTLGIGLLCLLGGGIAVAVLLRWTRRRPGAKTGSASDWFCGIVDILTAWL